MNAKALTTGTGLLSTTCPLLSLPLYSSSPNSALQRKIIRDRAEVSLTPRKPHIPLKSWPGNFREELKFYGSLGYRHPRGHSLISSHTNSVSRVWAAFTVGREMQ